MSWINRVGAARLAAGVAIAGIVTFGMTAGTAQARWEHQDEHGWHGYHHGWSGGYWGAPPVVYGDPYSYGYYPPPGVGINLGNVGVYVR